MHVFLVVEAIADLYENAHKARPDNEEILSALFMAHVRLGSYKKQQQTAMALHKLRPQKNPYYFWAVMSNVMQVRITVSSWQGVMLLLMPQFPFCFVLVMAISSQVSIMREGLINHSPPAQFCCCLFLSRISKCLGFFYAQFFVNGISKYLVFVCPVNRDSYIRVLFKWASACLYQFYSFRPEISSERYSKRR